MSENKCDMHGVHSEQIKQLFEAVKKNSEVIDRHGEDIQILKQNKASNDEKFERIFELLGDVKESINDIVEAMKLKNERLPNLVYGVGGSVVGGVIVGVVVWLITG